VLKPPSAPTAPLDALWNWDEARTRCLREARRFLDSQAEAEDAVQEAMLRAWRRRSTCRDADRPLPWLLQITRNEALRLRSRSQGRGEVGLEESGVEEQTEDPSDAAAERVAVRTALEELATEDRTLLEMRYAQDLTQPRLAELLDIPEGTVKVRLHRLRERLRVTLEVT
jgi:RNA polymerase sigma-70 factor, ECF subfamily